MNKLGFAIKLANQGAGNAIECNKGQWINKVVDIREYLKLFTGLHGTDNIVTFMSFDEGGCFLTQLRAISGRVGDFLSGWIYIPNTIEATGEEIMSAYNYVQNILFQSNINGSEIKEFFSKEYPEQEYVVQQYNPSSGEEFGVRFIDVYYRMKEVLDTNRYQPYYSNFKAIFLLDKNSEVKIAREQVARFKDLTKMPIEKTCVFKAPSPEEVRLLGKGTKIVFSTNQKEFNSPILTKKGEQIQLYAQREGFESVILPVITIQEDGQKCFIDPSTVTWKKRITLSMFKVCNSEHKKIKDVRIYINGTDISNGQDVFLYEEDCRQATVRYSAPDYEPYEHEKNLLLNEFCEIILDRKVKPYQTTIELANGNLAEMILESENLSSKCDSPLKGYGFEEEYHGKKVLKLSSWFVWKQRLWGLGAAVVTVMLIIAFATFDSWLDTHHFKVGLPPREKDRSTEQYKDSCRQEMDDVTIENSNDDNSEIQNSGDLSLKEAILYLDNNSTWSKTELDQYPDLQGLFDDMNTFNLSRLLGDWRSKLATSQNFQKVCESANKTLTNDWNPKQGSHTPTYNKPDDEQINLTNYINWLDQDQTPKPSSNNGGFHPNVGSNSGKKSGNSGKSNTYSAKQGTGKSERTTNGGL